jgi:hypothetical protein
MDSIHKASKFFGNEIDHTPACGGDHELDILGIFSPPACDRISQEMEQEEFTLDDERPVDLSQVILFHNDYFLPHGFRALMDDGG